MAGRIRQEDVEAVRQRSDIIKVVSEHLQLRKAGGDNFVGLCPFHPEKTPSFSVSPAKQLYLCRGCGEGGDVFTFLEKIEGLTFTEAAERLASSTGIALRYEGQADARAAGRRQTLHRAVARAAEVYHQTLLEAREAAEARDYLGRRGLSQASVDRFGIGYAPGYPDFLLKRLSRTFSPEVLVDAGLVAGDGAGNLRDRFRGRVLFPIHDLAGNAVGFGGRLVDSSGSAAGNAPKYVNSPESPIYQKGRLLYNLHRAKGDIIRAGRAFLVEGYTDVIGLDQAGVREAVATCGTALGEEHVRLLSRFTERVLLAFDSDEAGARAAERAFQFHEQYPVDLAVLVLPKGQDPADFVLSNGDDARERFESILDRAVPLVAYMIDRFLVGRSVAGPEDKARAVRHLVTAVLARLGDPVLREKYAGHVAGRVGVSVNAVLLEAARSAQGLSPEARDAAGARARIPARHSPGPPPTAGPARMAPAQKVEREALKLMVQNPALCADDITRVSVDHFTSATHQRAFELIAEAAADSPLEAAVLVARAQDRGDHLHKLMAAVAVEPPECAGPPTQGYARHVFLRLDEFSLSRRIEAVRKQLERLNPLTAAGEYDQLFRQFAALEGERRRVRETAQSVVSSG